MWMYLLRWPMSTGGWALSILLTEQCPAIGQGLVTLVELKEIAVNQSVQTLGWLIVWCALGLLSPIE